MSPTSPSGDVRVTTQPASNSAAPVVSSARPSGISPASTKMTSHSTSP